jgi:hypothetical protein
MQLVVGKQQEETVTWELGGTEMLKGNRNVKALPKVRYAPRKCHGQSIPFAK